MVKMQVNMIEDPQKTRKMVGFKELLYLYELIFS